MRKGILILLLLAIFTSCYSQEVKWIKPIGINAEPQFPVCITPNETFYQYLGTNTVIRKFDSKKDIWDTPYPPLYNHKTIIAANESDHFFKGGSYNGTFYLGKYDSSGRRIWELRNKTSNHLGVVKYLAKHENTYYGFGLWKDELCLGKDTIKIPFEGMFGMQFDENGTVLKYYKLATYTGTVQIQGMSLDKLGNMYVLGNYSETIRYSDSISDTLPQNAKGVFLACFNPDGILKWKKMFWVFPPKYHSFSRIYVNSIGVIAFSGICNDLLMMNNDTFIRHHNGHFTGFLDTAGNLTKVILMRTDSGSKMPWVSDIAADEAGNLYLSCFLGKNWDDSTLVDTLFIDDKIRLIRQAKYTWGFLRILDSNLNEKWLGILSSEGVTRCDNIYYQNNSIYLGVTKSPQFATINFWGKDYEYDGYSAMVKINFDYSPLNNKDTSNYPLVYPNPTRGMVHLVFKNNEKDYSIRVFDMQGRFLQEGLYKNPIHIPIDLSGNASGMYFVELVSGDTRKVVKVVVE